MLSARNIQRRAILFDDYRFISEVDFALEHRRTQIATNDVLLTIVGTIGRVAIVKNDTPEFALQRSVAVLRPSLAIAPQYLGYALESPRIQQHFIDTAKGTAQKGVYLKALGELELELAPLAEQVRIVNQLDTLLTRVQACNDRFDAIPALLKRFRQLVLMKSITGELTADWRKRNQQSNLHSPLALGDETIQVPAGWRLSNVQGIIDPDRPLCYGVVQPGEAQSGGVPLIRVQDLSSGTILCNQLRTVAGQIDQDFRRSRVKGGDLLISVVGTIGRAAIVPEEMTGNIARAIARVSCRDGVLNKWAYFWFTADPLQWHLLSNSREVARKTLNLGDLAEISIPIPPLQEQTEIVRRVEALFALAARIEARCTAARAQAQRLTPLVLAKAFRGELVPQDPNDEPASALLARIASSNTAVAGKNKKKVPEVRKNLAQAATNS